MHIYIYRHGDSEAFCIWRVPKREDLVWFRASEHRALDPESMEHNGGFGLLSEVLSHSVAYFWGPGRDRRAGLACQGFSGSGASRAPARLSTRDSELMNI